MRMSLHALSSHQLSEQAYNAIREAIVSGQFRPGTRLNQDDLAEQLKVSRAPVRDALNRLEAEGLVRSVNGRKGMVVTEMTAEELRAMFEVRILIDGFVARKACESISDVELAQLQQIVEGTAEALRGGDVDGVVQGHTDFHDLIYSICGNPEVIRIGRNLWDRSYRYRATALSVGDFALASIDDHRAILGAFQSRDCAEAEQLMVGHVRQNIDRHLQLMRARAAAAAEER